MKSLLNQTFLVVLFLGLSSMSPKEDKRDLVVGVPRINANQFEQLKQAIAGNSTIFYKGFCHAEKFLFLQYDANSISERDVVRFLAQQLQSDANSTIFLKPMDFATAENICGNDPKIYLR